jgi:dTDP-glucose pyrophosphorylase
VQILLGRYTEAGASGSTLGVRGAEITTLLEGYLEDGKRTVKQMGHGYTWLDIGTHASLLDAGSFVHTLEQRQGMQTGSPDEIDYRTGWITNTELVERSKEVTKNDYGQYLRGFM